MRKIKDIAQQLGVSNATVSMVLNNRPGVGEETRRRVSQVLVEAGYRIAAPAKGGGAGAVLQFVVYKKHGQVVGDTPFFSLLIEEIESAARENHYQLQLSYLSGPPQLQAGENTAQGILLLATEMTPEDIRPFLSLGVPVVAIDSALLGVALDKVLIGNFDGAYSATQYLYEKGHRRIGHLRSATWIKNFDERRGGYQSALRDRGLAVDEGYTVTLSPDTQGAYRDMLRYLAGSPQLPTAYFADNDVIAFGAMKALGEKGVAVPQQVSVIGFDDVPFCTMTSPPLTTMRVERKYIGKVAVERLIRILEGDCSYFLKQEVATTLVERGSVAPYTE